MALVLSFYFVVIAAIKRRIAGRQKNVQKRLRCHAGTWYLGIPTCKAYGRSESGQFSSTKVSTGNSKACRCSPPIPTRARRYQHTVTLIQMTQSLFISSLSEPARCLWLQNSRHNYQMAESQGAPMMFFLTSDKALEDTRQISKKNPSRKKAPHRHQPQRAGEENESASIAACINATTRTNEADRSNIDLLFE